MPVGQVKRAPTAGAQATLLARHRSLSRQLRKRRLALERKIEPLTGAPERPDLYFDHAPSGRYPIVALRTVPCDLYVKGFCGPCSYSARSYPPGLSSQGIYRGIELQLDWLLEHFDELFTNQASGRLDGYRLRHAPDGPWYMLQLAGESSFFRDAEVPPTYRRKILERMCAFQDEHGINLHLMLESRAEHLIAAEESGELQNLSPLLDSLDVVVNVGFEWDDDFLRNVVFAKGLDRSVFIQAMRIAIQRRLDPGVFLFAGASILTTAELLTEIDRGLAFLGSQGLFANVMVPNLQAYTLPDLLHEGGRYRLPEPFFLLDVADRLLAFRPRRPHPVTPFDWFIGGLESDPPPRLTLLDHPARLTSDSVTRAIHTCILRLVRTMDSERYHQEARRLRATADFRYHREDLQRMDRRPWLHRFAEDLDFAEQYVETYDARIRTGLAPAA